MMADEKGAAEFSEQNSLVAGNSRTGAYGENNSSAKNDAGKNLMPPYLQQPFLGTLPHKGPSPVIAHIISELPEHITPHEALFWGSGEGPELMQSFVQVVLVGGAAYVAFFAAEMFDENQDKIYDEHGKSRDSVMKLIATLLIFLIPLVGSAFLVPSILFSLVISSSVEKMKVRKMIDKVRQGLAMKKVETVLHLIKFMKANVHAKAKASGSRGSKIKIKSAREMIPDNGMYEQKRAEAWELFDLFDHDGTHSINEEELFELLKKLQVVKTMKEVKMVMLELDSDKSGSVEFEEFFDWLVAQHGTTSPEDIEHLVDEMFSFLTGGKEHITHESFKAAMESLGCGLQDQDVYVIIRSIDKDMSGTIEKEEFAEFLVEHHMNS